jgi:hypothetical protein
LKLLGLDRVLHFECAYCEGATGGIKGLYTLVASLFIIELLSVLRQQIILARFASSMDAARRKIKAGESDVVEFMRSKRYFINIMSPL